MTTRRYRNPTSGRRWSPSGRAGKSLAPFVWLLCVLFLVAGFACQSDDVTPALHDEPATDDGAVSLPRHHEPPVINSDDATPSPHDEPATDADAVSLPRHYEPPVINSGDEYVFGELRQSGRCLRISYIDQTYPELTRRGLLVIWPPGFHAVVHDDVVQVADPDGHVLAKTGDTVRLSGRKVSEDSTQAPQLDWDGEPVVDCVGPYWLVGDEVSAGVPRYPSNPADSTIFFPRLAHQYGPILSMAALLEGRLELQGECLRVVTTWGPEGFVIVWPPGFGVREENGQIVVVNGGGSVIVRVGDDVALGGGQPPRNVFPEGSRCPGEIWNAMSVSSVP